MISEHLTLALDIEDQSLGIRKIHRVLLQFCYNFCYLVSSLFLFGKDCQHPKSTIKNTTLEMPGLVNGRSSRAARYLPGVAREDSDDELGTDDLPWEWIYETEEPEPEPAAENGRKRKRQATQEPQIIGARMGSFDCYLGDMVLLKAEGSNEAWVGIICDFQTDEEGEKAANFMWFSSEKEIRNPKKRTDSLEVSVTSASEYEVMLINLLF